MKRRRSSRGCTEKLAHLAWTLGGLSTAQGPCRPALRRRRDRDSCPHGAGSVFFLSSVFLVEQNAVTGGLQLQACEAEATQTGHFGPWVSGLFMNLMGCLWAAGLPDTLLNIAQDPSCSRPTCVPCHGWDGT